MERQVALVDDRVVAELTLEGEPPPPLAVHAPDAPILTVGSMSKLFWAGLRVGWIRAPEPIVARITRFKAVLDLGTSVPGQVVATHLLGLVEEVRAERRRELSARFTLVQRLLAELLPSWSWAPPSGGLTLWVRLPFGSARELAALARRRGVAVLPGPVTSPDMSFDGHLRLTVSREPDVLVEGMRRLAAAWEE
jgi:DNA-binding transcriptional MocR family regulator